MESIKYVMKKIDWYAVSLIRNVSGALFVIFMPVVFLIAFLSRFVKKKYDIGLGPVPMINNVYFKKSLESQGYSAQTYVIDLYKITNEFDCVMKNWLYRRMPFLRLFPILFKYKCLYIYFDGGVLAGRKVYRYLEAFVYKAAGIKTVVMPYGSDCFIAERTPNLCIRNANFHDYSHYFKKYHSRIVWQISYWCKNATTVIAYGDMVDFLSYWDRIYPSIFSVDLNRLKPDKDYKFGVNDTFCIVHAPNHMNFKGSSFIEQAISRLREEGYQIDYCLLHNKTNAEVLETLKHADIIIDQIILGWHGIFALEGMAFGKPVITHIRPDLQNTYEELGCLEKNELPLVDATPNTIYEVLKDLMDHPQKLEEIGKRARVYVEKHHSIEVIGKYFDEINQSMGVTPSRLQEVKSK